MAPHKVSIFNSIMPISSPNPMFDNLLELCHRDDLNKWSNIRFGEEIMHSNACSVDYIANFTHLILISVYKTIE